MSELTDEQAAGLFELLAVALSGALGWVATGEIGIAATAAGTAMFTIAALHRVVGAEVDRATRGEA